MIEVIEPFYYADRLKNTKVLMINGTSDPIVPQACAEKFARCCGTTILWYPTDHYGMVKYIFPVTQQILDHFSPTTSWD